LNKYLVTFPHFEFVTMLTVNMPTITKIIVLKHILNLFHRETSCFTDNFVGNQHASHFHVFRVDFSSGGMAFEFVAVTFGS
jgi:hypothetical protein